MIASSPTAQPPSLMWATSSWCKRPKGKMSHWRWWVLPRWSTSEWWVRTWTAIASHTGSYPTRKRLQLHLKVSGYCLYVVIVFVLLLSLFGGGGGGRLHFVIWKFISLRSSGVLPWGKPAVTEWCYLSNKSLMLCKCRDLVYFSTICTGHGIVAQQHLHVLLVTVLKHTSDQFRTTC